MMISHDQQRVDLRYQLCNMISNTLWSYAIFWTVSSTNAGVIEWGEGYYNGETKDGKTATKSCEVDTNEKGIHRSEQLRKLYMSLLEAKFCEQGKKRTSVATTLSMDELSNLEWFYLLSMSFSFNFDQSLPGRAYVTGQHIWLCDAQTADSKLFTRSLLAKSAAVQTVICFPCMGGVIELGSTELMSEDVELIERILKTSPELAKPVCSKISSSAPYSTEYDRNHLVDVLPSIDFTADHIFDTEIENVVHQSIVQNLNITSSDDCSIGWASPSQNKRLKGSTTSYGFVHRAVDTETGDDIHHSRGRLIRANGCSERLNSQEKNDFPSESQPYDLNLMHSISRNLTDNVPLYASEVERECEQFMILRSMVPSLTKTDEPSILSVVSPDKELDFGMDLEDSTPTNGFDKANEADIVQFIDVEMSSINDDVRVEMSCLWRDYLLLDIMKALHNLNLDTYTVQSSTFGGALFLSLKAKLRGAAFMSETMIKQALRRIINNC